MTHICVSKLTTVGSDNGLAPGRRQAIIWADAGILSSWPLDTNFCETLTEIHTFSLIKMYLKMLCQCEMAAILSRPQCVNASMDWIIISSGIYLPERHYLNTCWLVNYVYKNNFQWNTNPNAKFSLQENALENVFWIACLLFCSVLNVLTHWGRVTHICVSKNYHHWFR